MLFKPQNYYKIYRDWPISYERDYDYSPEDNRLFNSLEIISLYETNEWAFLHRDNEPEYGTDAYKNLQKELTLKKMYIVYIGTFILSVDEKTFKSIKDELSNYNKPIVLSKL